MASIRKRGDSYQITVSCGYDATGKKIMETATFTPDPKKTEKQNRKALEIFAFEFEQKVKSGNYLEGEKMTFKSYSDKWLTEYAKPKLAFSTYSNYKMNINSRIIPAIGHMKISQIKPLHIQMFYNELSGSPRNDKKGGNLSVGSIRKIHAILSSMFHTAVLWQIVESNPCDRVSPSIDHHKINVIPKHFTLEQADCFIKALDLDLVSRYGSRSRKDSHGNIYNIAKYETKRPIPLQVKAFFHMALFGGFRRGEILALTWSDINFENGTANISKSLTIENHQLTIKSPKNVSSTRIVSLPEHVIELLRLLLVTQKEYSLKIGSQWVGSRGANYNDNFLFIQWNGTVMHLDTPYQWFKKIINNYNQMQIGTDNLLPQIPLHGLRHTSATLLISQNVDIRTVSGRLGHSQASTTMNIYAHSLRKSDEAAAQTLEKLLIQ